MMLTRSDSMRKISKIEPKAAAIKPKKKVAALIVYFP